MPPKKSRHPQQASTPCGTPEKPPGGESWGQGVASKRRRVRRGRRTPHPPLRNAHLHKKHKKSTKGREQSTTTGEKKKQIGEVRGLEGGGETNKQKIYTYSYVCIHISRARCLSFLRSPSPPCLLFLSLGLSLIPDFLFQAYATPGGNVRTGLIFIRTPTQSLYVRPHWSSVHIYIACTHSDMRRIEHIFQVCPSLLFSASFSFVFLYSRHPSYSLRLV